MNKKLTYLTGIIFTLCAAAVSIPLHAATLPDTGQMFCEDGGDNQAACTKFNTSDASILPRQDGRYGRDAAMAAGVLTKVGGGIGNFDYTKIANNGSPLSAAAVQGSAAGDWACTQDNLTGLMWETKTADSGLRDYRWEYSWYSTDSSTNGGDAGLGDTGLGTSTLDSWGKAGSDNCSDPVRCDTEKYAADVNNAGLCGFSDWRLPSKRELETLLYFGNETPEGIDSNYFPGGVDPSALYVWTGTTNVGWLIGWPGPLDVYSTADHAYSVSFRLRASSQLTTKDASTSVTALLVRGATF